MSTNTLTVTLTDRQSRELTERADAEGRTPEEFAAEALLEALRQRAAQVRRLGAAYAANHADLLRRLGE
jgi:hypothetical protein